MSPRVTAAGRITPPVSGNDSVSLEHSADLSLTLPSPHQLIPQQPAVSGLFVVVLF